MIIGRDSKGRSLSKNEAYFICGILNSDIVVQYMQNTFKSNGYSLKKSHFYLPLYNKDNMLHKKIVELSKTASKARSSEKVVRIQSKLSDLYLELCENDL